MIEFADEVVIGFANPGGNIHSMLKNTVKKTTSLT